MQFLGVLTMPRLKPSPYPKAVPGPLLWVYPAPWNSHVLQPRGYRHVILKDFGPDAHNRYGP